MFYNLGAWLLPKTILCTVYCGWYKGLKTSFMEDSHVALLIPPSLSLEMHLSCIVGKPIMWFPNRSDTNRPVQAQKRARSLKFRILVVEELYYPSSKNKGADQLRGYREFRGFRLCRLLVFPQGGSFDIRD